jgi:hypothetical protein
VRAPLLFLSTFDISFKRKAKNTTPNSKGQALAVEHHWCIMLTLQGASMARPIKEEWTIVILGAWNVSIFNPDWLAANIFSRELTIEFGLDPLNPAMPRRFTADDVTIISTSSKLIIAPSNLEEATLLKAEQMACKILELLNHTPVTAIGINFGYQVKPLLDEFNGQYPTIRSDKFTEQSLIVQSRLFKWTISDRGQIINLSCNINDEEARLKFNFHNTVTNTVMAKSNIAGKFIVYRDKAKGILKQVFEVEVED